MGMFLYTPAQIQSRIRNCRDGSRAGGGTEVGDGSGIVLKTLEPSVKLCRDLKQISNIQKDPARRSQGNYKEGPLTFLHLELLRAQ